MSSLPPSHCTKLGLKMQGHTSVLLPTETSKGSRPSKWKSFVSTSLILYIFQIIEQCEHRRIKKNLLIELIVFYWLLKGNALLFFFSSEDGFFICSINGRNTITGLLNDPVCCAVFVSNGFYFLWMPNISKCPETKQTFSRIFWGKSPDLNKSLEIKT